MLARRVLFCALWLGLTSAAARADQLVAEYKAYWAGLPAAQIRLELGSAAGNYRDKIEISTEGLPRLITHFRASAQTVGRLGPRGSAQPSHYDAVYDLRKWRDSHIALRFVARDGSVIAERTAEDTSKKALLDEQYRRNIVDPLTALEAVRAAIAAQKTGADRRFVVPVYDGTRRFDVVGQVLPKAEQTPGALRIALQLRPIAGFKGQSKIDGDPDNAPRPVTVTLTNDQRLLPLSVEMRVFFLPLAIRLDHIRASSST